MPNRVQIRFIKDALDNEHMLTDCEREFINDLADKDDDYQLSEKQNKTLNKIQRKIS